MSTACRSFLKSFLGLLGSSRRLGASRPALLHVPTSALSVTCSKLPVCSVFSRPILSWPSSRRSTGDRLNWSRHVDRPTFFWMLVQQSRDLTQLVAYDLWSLCYFSYVNTRLAKLAILLQARRSNLSSDIYCGMSFLMDQFRASNSCWNWDRVELIVFNLN